MNKISAQELLRPSVIALVLANLAPVYGVLFLGWQVFPILTILGGGFLAMALHVPIVGLLVLLLLKIGLDVCAHLRERQKLGGVTGGDQPAAIF